MTSNSLEPSAIPYLPDELVRRHTAVAHAMSTAHPCPSQHISEDINNSINLAAIVDQMFGNGSTSNENDMQDYLNILLQQDPDEMEYQVAQLLHEKQDAVTLPPDSNYLWPLDKIKWFIAILNKILPTDEQIEDDEIPYLLAQLNSQHGETHVDLTASSRRICHKQHHTRTQP